MERRQEKRKRREDKMKEIETHTPHTGRGVALTPGVELPGVGPPGAGGQCTGTGPLNLYIVYRSAS